ncbi:MAG: metallopeptidase TldD-related protein [Clostridia bacterium]|nr:metallopeptidase TldD-related protein [Clostridia bacterium]
MFEKIIEILKKSSADAWRLTEKTEETGELFFVKHQLDTRRIKDTHKFSVTVFKDGEAGGNKLRGCTDTEILPSDGEDEIERRIADAVYAAGFAMNPYYELADAVTAPKIKKTGSLAEDGIAVSIGKMAKALFAPDVREDAFLNSAEIFGHKRSVRIVTSAGTDVSYTDAEVKGEFVVQCKEPEDVEMYHDFKYDSCDTDALSEKVAEALDFVADRAKAEKVLKSGKYDLVLCGAEVEEVLGYYAERANAAMIFPHYSTWKAGDDVQGETTGEKLALTLTATSPYSSEGIAMKDLPLVRDGKLENVFGTTQFCRYLGITPTGNHSKLTCENAGTLSFEEMKRENCLVAVAFSDFQMDSFSGHFGGEIRLAYLIADGKITPVTGGSVNGSLLEAQKSLVFSTDRYKSASFDGPYALKMKDVAVAGL